YPEALVRSKSVLGGSGSGPTGLKGQGSCTISLTRSNHGFFGNSNHPIGVLGPKLGPSGFLTAAVPAKNQAFSRVFLEPRSRRVVYRGTCRKVPGSIEVLAVRPETQLEDGDAPAKARPRGPRRSGYRGRTVGAEPMARWSPSARADRYRI